MCLGCLFGSMVIGNSAAIVAAWALRFAFVLGGFSGAGGCHFPVSAYCGYV